MANNQSDQPQKGTAPCHAQACAIQSCLMRNNYSEARCQNVVLDLYKCCESFYKESGNGATTPSCPKPDLLKLKLQQLRND